MKEVYKTDFRDSRKYICNPNINFPPDAGEKWMEYFYKNMKLQKKKDQQRL